MQTRRTFLRSLGSGLLVAAAAPVVAQVEPVRRFWQVGRNAPVGARIQLANGVDSAEIAANAVGWSEMPEGDILADLEAAEMRYGFKRSPVFANGNYAGHVQEPVCYRDVELSMLGRPVTIRVHQGDEAAVAARLSRGDLRDMIAAEGLMPAPRFEGLSARITFKL